MPEILHEIAVLAAEAAWRNADDPQEVPVQVALVGEADAQGNLACRGAVPQQLLGLCHTAMGYVLVRCDSGVIRKCRDEVVGA